MNIFTDIRSGLQFCMKMGNPCAQDILNNGIYEYDMIKWCEQFLTPDGTFVDIGAHMGTYSVILSKKCKEVWSFEAQKETHDCLTVSLSINNCNARAHHVALGAHEGTAIIHQISEDGGGSTIRHDVVLASGQQVKLEEEVPMRTLDSYEIKNIDFMKIDVEGFELEVLKGASETLKNNNFPPFIFEAWQDEWYKSDKDALIKYIKELGYKVHQLSGANNMFLAADHPERNKKREEAEEVVEESPYNIPSLCKQYDDLTLQKDKSITWDQWHALGKHYRLQSQHTRCYDCIRRAFSLNPPKDKLYLLYEELSIICYYINKLDEGYQACERVILSPNAPWNSRNTALSNQAFYRKSIPFKSVKTITYDLPKGYSPSSSSIIPYGDGYCINVRAVNYTIDDSGRYTMHDNSDNIVRTFNYLLTLDSNLDVLDGGELLNITTTPLYPKNIQGFEDVRLFSPSQFQCTSFEINNERIGQICYGEFDIESKSITRIIPLSLGTEPRCEKNWLPFIQNGEVFFIYAVSPLKLYKMNQENGALTLVKELDMNTTEISMNDFRGSACPIPYKNGWLATVHQVYFGSGRRKYFHRFIWFDIEFTEIKYSPIFYFEATDIEFNLSLCHSNEGLLMTYSRCDNCSKIGLLDYSVIDEWLKC